MRADHTRARSPEQKEERRVHLLATARRMLEGGTHLRDLSLNELARHAGMAKANVYRYFESREAVLLALLREDWAGWLARFQGRRLAPRLDTLMTSLARSIAGEPLLCALTAALPSVLEQNLGEEAIRAFKAESLTLFRELARALHAACPELTEAAYVELAHDAASAIMALYPNTHPSPAAARALEDPELAFFRRDFATELGRFLRALAARPRAAGRAEGRGRLRVSAQSRP